MNQAYWLEPIDRSALLAALMRELAGDAELAMEGDADDLLSFDFSAVPGVRRESSSPLRREWSETSKVLIVPLNAATIEPILAQLKHDEALDRIGAIQISQRGEVQFLAGDNFHPECVSVGQGVPKELLEKLMREQVIRAYRTPEEARTWLRRRLR